MRSNFESGLNQHGHAFQHRVIAEAIRLAEDPASSSPWRLAGVEIPVRAGSRTTRIDFVLEDRSHPHVIRFLLAECKRVNPAYGAWCFTQAPQWLPEWVGKQLVVESLVNHNEVMEEEVKLVTAGTGGPTSQSLYSVGFALKTKAAGDAHPVSMDKDALESACTQVCAGLNGFMETLLSDERYREAIEDAHLVQFLPVIFTTAKLFTSTVNLSSADLQTGELKLEEDPCSPDWLYYQYPQSPDLKHSLRRGSLSGDTLATRFTRDFVRSVGISSGGGIPRFLEEGWREVDQDGSSVQ